MEQMPATSPAADQTRWRGLPARQLSNGIVELLVVPQTGRIARFAFVGGKNVLWENPAPMEEEARQRGYNFGGDKVWVWPQAEWPRRLGRAWPGPAQTDEPHELQLIDEGRGVRLTSPVFSDYGFRVVRDITLSGSAARIRTRFQKVQDGYDFASAVWTVSEIPFPDALAARLSADSRLPQGHRQDPSWGPRADWRLVATDVPNVMVVSRPTATSGKVFIDADALGAAIGDVAFIQRVRESAAATAPAEGGWAPGDRAQLYTQAANSDAPFVELELTSPMRSLPKGRSLTLDVIWELHHIQPQSASRDLPRLLSADAPAAP